MKLGFIGGGNMAAAMIGGMLQKGFSAADIVVAETSAERRDWLQQEYAVAVQADPALILAAEVIVLAVKPQQLSAVLRALPPLQPGQLVLSIAAGVRAEDISRWLGGHAAVVRAMPNTPALVGAGISWVVCAAWCQRSAEGASQPGSGSGRSCGLGGGRGAD
jgi:pyrroline-5-carboxylate reductase